MKLTIKNKLFLGFDLVVIIVAIISVNSITKLDKVNQVEHQLIDLRLPTVMAGIQLTDGNHLSLASLRGYMIRGKGPAFNLYPPVV
ncbi:MAG: hypothetical protein DIZ80_15175 [endosymbiont of Galathealinum brachiosum]|uniref:Uncharacterized protein n=1 Tax=endosymbiont of Galathealinum brachiosum TaxID=2200906 RepID=A0A370DAV2_9GAMM|nr:MAG: hypothetical protein DIZ80_15175 [endosymbiont of Galathealinum brachiosum]